MAHNFGSLAFTPAIKALQEKYGSRRQYARLGAGSSRDRLGPQEKDFLAERDSFYIASIGSTGWPYVQHRGGPAGFLHVVDDQTVAFADLRGHKQYISAGNLTTDNRVALILVDYPAQARLKILGRAEIVEGEQATEWLKLTPLLHDATPVERVFVLHMEAFDWNCPQHIVPRYTVQQIHNAISPIEARLSELETENAGLSRELSRLSAKCP
jgi:predicted pyridoxine 5'-phosphate oxidase superfamily flavin-nucleotide-binding protein